MTGELEARLGSNESTFREINEAIERGQWPGEETAQVGFRCECAQLGCTDVVELSGAAYERVRAHARRFIVAPGHENPTIETVVEDLGAYRVVEKRDQAAERAEATDPRS